VSAALPRAIAYLALLVVAGCGFGGPHPTIVIPMGTNAFGDYATFVYDETGLVTSGQVLVRPPAADVEGVVAVPERSQLEIRWLGGACAHRPTVHLTGNANALSIVVANPADPQLLPGPVACPAVGIRFGITLSLSMPVQQDAVSIDLR
jgi:hypothetical protein